MTVKELMDKLSEVKNKNVEVYCEADDYPYGSGYYEVNSVTLSGGSDRVYLNVFIDD